MCLKIDAWLCFGSGSGHEDDYCCDSAKDSGAPHHHAGAIAKPTTPQQAQRNGHYRYGHHGAAHHANGHKAPHHHQLPVADEEDRKASNDARRFHNATAMKGAHGYAAGAPYVHPGDDGLLKHPATNAKIADGAGHGTHYYYQERQPAHKGEYYRSQ